MSLEKKNAGKNDKITTGNEFFHYVAELLSLKKKKQS